MAYIVGIDPGISGALTFLNVTTAEMFIIDMPIFEYDTTKTRKKTDPYTLVRALTSVQVKDVYIEDIASSPQMGVTSAFTFGEGKGILLGIAAALGIPVTLVKPAQWKKVMRTPADKRAAVQRASQLFPAAAKLFVGTRGGVLDGRAESALIALYGALEQGKTPDKPVTVIGVPDVV